MGSSHSSQHPDPQRAASAGGSDSAAAPLSSQASLTAGGFVVPEDDLTVISDRASSPASFFSSKSRPMAAADLGIALAGERLDHFELIEYVGGGGMGAVFRARDTLLNREVALKVLSRDQGADDDTRRRFQNEAQSAARLDHENIARVYYVGEDQGLNYIAFEFILGVNVREVVAQKGPLPLAEAMSYTLQVAEALAHASSRDVVHRDIKPSNIIITDEGRAKLVDMGLARLHQVRSPAEDLTASGVTLGTFDYISPEQARDPRSADVRSDIYSLGCTFYYMLTAQPPFPDGTVLQKLLQHQGDEAPDPRSLRPELPEAISAIVGKMLAKNPRARYQDPNDLVAELMLLANEAGLSTPGVGGAVWIQRQVDRRTLLERHLPWLVPTAALLCVFAVLEWMSHAASNQSAEPPPPPTRGASAGPAVVADAASHGFPIPRRHDDTATAKATDERDPNELGPHETGPTPAPSAGRETDSAPVAAADKTATTDYDATREAIAATGQTGTTTPTNPAATSSDLDDLPVNPTPRSTTDTAKVNPRTTSSQAAGALRPPKLSGGASTAPEVHAELSLASAAQAASASLAAATGGALASSTSSGSTPAVDATHIDAAHIDAAPVVFLIDSSGEGRRPFASLEAACSAAKDNDVVELQYNGRREAQPIALANQKLTIRGDPRFRPVVVFRAAKFGAPGFATSMITVAGGRLNVVNVALELDIPHEAAAESWSLIETRQADEVRLNRCWLTIRNAADKGQSYFQGVAFFNVKAAPGADSMMKDPTAPLDAPDSYELKDCVARGQAVLVRSADLQPFNLHWENGLLATTEQLLLAGGGSMTSPHGARIQLDLRHLTLLARGGLCKLVGTPDAPYLLDAEIKCSDSILLGGPGSAVIDQTGINRGGPLQQQFTWTGDHNICQGFASFWKIVDLTFPSEPQTLAFSKGEAVVEATSAIWNEPPAEDRTVDTFTLREFVLAHSKSGEPKRFEASDGEPAGLNAARIPSPPVERATATDAKIVPAEPRLRGDPEGDDLPPGGTLEAAPLRSEG